MVSQIGNPVRSGVLCSSPVTLITPARPCTIWSKGSIAQ
jgi:hypothetical protein